MMHGFGGLLGFLALILSLWFTYRILQKAGFSPWLCLLILIPVVNIIVLWLFAFKRWPIDNR